MRVFIGNDHRGVAVKQALVQWLRDRGRQVEDLGALDSEPVDYPDVAAAVGRRLDAGGADRGILICGTGIGMCIAANKVPGVRAALCHDARVAEISRRHNDANVLCLPETIAETLSSEGLRALVETWLTTPFEGGRHARRVEKIGRIEQENNHPQG